MATLDSFTTDDMERFRAWLASVLVPTLVEPQYFESMGFDPAFVRRFYRKYACVVRFDGTIARNVRGINELEMLRPGPERPSSRALQQHTHFTARL